MRELFLTGFYSGNIPKAPGTWGSVVGLILGVLILQFLPQSTLFLFAFLITVIAVKVIDRYEKETGIHDDKRIVIDEIAGMFIAMSIACKEIYTGVLPDAIFQGVVAFLFFRLFDIWKPSIIGKIDEKVQGGWGVMGDDLVAGLFAGISTAFCYMIYTQFI